MLFIVSNVSIQLSKIFMAEWFILQLDNNTAMKNTVIEYQIRKIVLIVNYNALLSCLKAKPSSHFQQKFLKMIHQRLLKVRF